VPHVDRLPGGLADALTPMHFDPEQLRFGTDVEMEHTSDRGLAQEIAMDHLAEDPAYYKKLVLIHNPSRAAWGWGIVAAAAALTAVGVGAAWVARRRLLDLGRLTCAEDNGVVGVDVNYYGEYWAQRGRKSYWRARRAGATDAESIALYILRDEVTAGSGREANVEACLAQFPPHGETHPRNILFWQNLMDAVRREMAAEQVG
jgi:hypothetical protein